VQKRLINGGSRASDMSRAARKYARLSRCETWLQASDQCGAVIENISLDTRLRP
jgi:hypothetical protein